MTAYETAQDQFVTIGGIKFAYRLHGPKHGIPLALFHGFRGTIDHWDPALVNPLAARRPVVLIDNAGVGRSEGAVPKSLTEWANHYIEVLGALGIQRADVLGYSMGGGVAQLVALNAPRLVRRLILCGTTPSTGDGVVTAPLGPFNQLKAAATLEEHKQAFLLGAFSQSRPSQAAGEAAWNRIVNARSNPRDNVDADNSDRQAIAFAKFMNPQMPREGSYNRFEELRMPVLVANGFDDVLVPVENSYLMLKMLKNADAQLHLYRNAGHGFLYQYADEFSSLVNSFLDAEPSKSRSHL